MLNLSKNIEGIQLFVGSFQSFVAKYECSEIYFKEHPLTIGYAGIQEERDWICDEVSGYYPSFFSYWKKLVKHLNVEEK
jgi:deoxyribodipyrimidine photo-lyase